MYILVFSFDFNLLNPVGSIKYEFQAWAFFVIIRDLNSLLETRREFFSRGPFGHGFAASIRFKYYKVSSGQGGPREF